MIQGCTPRPAPAPKIFHFLKMEMISTSTKKVHQVVDKKKTKKKRQKSSHLLKKDTDPGSTYWFMVFLSHPENALVGFDRPRPARILLPALPCPAPFLNKGATPAWARACGRSPAVPSRKVSPPRKETRLPNALPRPTPKQKKAAPCIPGIIHPVQSHCSCNVRDQITPQCFDWVSKFQYR